MFDSLISSLFNWDSNRRANKYQDKWFYDSLNNQNKLFDLNLNENKRQYDTSLAFNQSQAQLQQQNWEKNFAQQQYNYENASQIRANDMQKAGLNPLMLVGGAEGSTPVSLGSSVSAPGSTGSASAPGASAPSAHSANYQVGLGLLNTIIQSKERDKDRKNAKQIAEINAEAEKYKADKGYSGTVYSSDSSKDSSKYSSETSAAIAGIVNKTRQDELKENKRQFDENMSQRSYEFEERYFQEKKLALIHEDNENARKLADVTSANYRAALGAYESAIRNSAEFALSVNRLKLEWDKYNTEKDFKKRELALENTKIALDSATSIFQSLSHMTGDICKGFLIGRLKK